MAVRLPICWDKANVKNAISLKAKLDEKQTHYFLACHSPMKHIQDERAGRSLNEEDLYQKIMESAQRDVLAVIYGDQGTGKSHLINWLKLRCDSALDSGELTDVVPVLIQRRTGSLKDALEQMLVQLGERFQKHLDPVRQAIERISDETARQMLANQLSVELGPGWKDRNREPLPRLLRELGQACRAKGFGGWFCRDGGVIDQRIKLLTEASDVQERDSLPGFQESDFKIPPRYQSHSENSGEVFSLIEELEDSKSLREDAAGFVNDALHYAIKDMLGLSGANLRTVFDVIRQDLQADGKRLALFLEDVSVMAELDVEVVNALEPQDRHDICPLTAVVGMTRTGHSHLRDNQLDRIEVLACVDGDTTHRWAQNGKELARFTARYLNAVRLDESDVSAIEEHRREHRDDIHISKCTTCDAKRECHARFGKVRIGEVDVGLYPLTLDAPFRILDHIRRDEASTISANQRDLLIRILSPVLSEIDPIAEQRFPDDGTLPISVSDPIFWTEFLQNYCGGWDDANRLRIRYLAELWIAEAATADEAASQLVPLLDPFGLPEFSREAPRTTTQPEDKPDKPDADTKNRKSGQSSTDKAAERRINLMLQHLRTWCDGEHLKGDREFRIMVANFLRRSIPWDLERQPPVSEWKRWLSPPGKDPYDFVLIEGQVSKPATTLFFIDTFPRNEETRALLEALVRFEHEGKKSWDFHFGEHHKRTTQRWIRNHTDAVIQSLGPKVDADAPIASAVQFLTLVATVRRRERLPQSAADLVGEVFAPCWETTPTTLSKTWGDLIADMESRHGDVSDFLKSELAVVQGRTGGLNFIDPRQVIQTVGAFQKKPQVEPLPSKYFESFWKRRYFDGLSGGLQAYSKLRTVLDAERSEIKQRVSDVAKILDQAGYDTKDLKGAFVSFCQDLDELVETRKSTKFYLPTPEFDDLYKSRVLSENRQSWAFALERARKVTASNDVYDVLLYDPAKLIAAFDALQIIENYVTLLDRELLLQEGEVKKGGDPRELEIGLLEGLGQIAEIANEEETPHVATD